MKRFLKKVGNLRLKYIYGIIIFDRSTGEAFVRWSESGNAAH